MRLVAVWRVGFSRLGSGHAGFGRVAAGRVGSERIVQDQRRFQHSVVSGVFAGLHEHAPGWFIPVALHWQDAPDAKPDGIQSHTQSWQGLGIIDAEKTALMAQQRGRSPAKSIEGRCVAVSAWSRAQGAFPHMPWGGATPPVVGGIGQNGVQPVAGRLNYAPLLLHARLMAGRTGRPWLHCV